MSFRPPVAEAVEIPGPAGALQGIVEVPEGATPQYFGVLCHPHPLHGGTLSNKVVHTLARAFNEAGVPAVRFNFRGVGSSSGSFDNGIGETQDALAAIEYGRKRWPGARLWLGGFSFGGVVSIRAAATSAPALLISVAPAVTRLDVSSIVMPDCPWLLIQGDADDVIEPKAVLDWAARLEPAPTVKVLAEAGHFFHGRLHELHDAALDFIRAHIE